MVSLCSHICVVVRSPVLFSSSQRVSVVDMNEDEINDLLNSHGLFKGDPEPDDPEDGHPADDDPEDDRDEL